MRMTDAATLARAPRALVTSAAGCGKTYLIAEAVCRYGTRRDLVLTHTHAGVDALYRKVRSLDNGASNVVVDTIASWALRYVAAFPKSSGLQDPIPKTKEEWDNIYDKAATLLRRGAIRDVLKASYSGVYIDEYQDCTIQQHDLIVSIAETLPTRVLGDPLQGIFDFGQNRPVDWDRHVRPTFVELPALIRPWRWEREGHNRALGQWLAEVREALLRGRPVNLRNSPIRWECIANSNPIHQVNVLLEVARRQGTVVAIHGVSQQCHFIGQRLKGQYQCVEPIDSRDLFDAGRAIESAHGPMRVAAVIDFASKCMTQVRTKFRSVRDTCHAGAIPRRSRGQSSYIHDALRSLATKDSFAATISVLELLSTMPKTIIYRRELLTEMIRGLRRVTSEAGSLCDALWVIRNQTRSAGRRLGRCVVGTTLLVKGLEFDHAVILDADTFDSKNLYVALTRGSLSLTVFSRAEAVTPN